MVALGGIAVGGGDAQGAFERRFLVGIGDFHHLAREKERITQSDFHRCAQSYALQVSGLSKGEDGAKYGNDDDKNEGKEFFHACYDVRAV